jgi:triacylglycerol lipase
MVAKSCTFWPHVKGGRRRLPAAGRTLLGTLLAITVLRGGAAAASTNAPPDHVVLLHGLGRTSHSMQRMAEAFRGAGYVVWNMDYPSREATVADLSPPTRKTIEAHTATAPHVHVVTHSMGGILLRHIQATDPIPNLGRVVMLAPPSGGSEVVDRLGALGLFARINGPAGRELGTGSNSVPSQLPPVNFELGVIAGNRSINGIHSLFLIPGPDDGKVSVTRARTAGMRDFRVVPVSHPFIMRDPEVIALCLTFVATGAFSPTPPAPGATSP